MKEYDIFEQFDGYAFGITSNDWDWDMIIDNQIIDVKELEDEDQRFWLFKKWLDANKFPEVDSYHIKECIEFFEFSLTKDGQIKTGKNAEIFKKARNYFVKNKQIILDELKRLSEIQKNHNEFEKSLPNEIIILKRELEPTIVIEMSAGLPQAYIRILTEEDYGNGKSVYYTICEPGSKMSEKAPIWLNGWCNTVNKLLKQNANLFMDEMYYETEVDRMTVAQVAIGVPIELIGTPSIKQIEKLVFNDNLEE